MPDKTLALILGGGTGARLFFLTAQRSKPAVPFGGKYRLVDVRISNYLNSGIRRIFVLTQFNSASLNNHVGRTYRFDSFGRSSADIIAAEQTPEHKDWFQGTADAARQNLQHIITKSTGGRARAHLGRRSALSDELPDLLDEHFARDAEVRHRRHGLGSVLNNLTRVLLFYPSQVVQD